MNPDALSNHTNHFPFIIQVTEEISPARILWEDLLQAEKAKVEAMPELQEMEKLFWAELDEIEEFSWIMPTMPASSLWQECPVRDSENQPSAKVLVKRKVVSSFYIMNI